MAGYAPNPTSSSQSGYASLTAGLLARKGEAMPAVDADAHAGVDVDLRAVGPSGGREGNVSQQTIESLYPPNPGSGAGPEAGGHTDLDRLQSRIVNGHGGSHGAGRESHGPAQPDVAPDIWTIGPARAPRPSRRRAGMRAHPGDDHQRKATVTFRIPAKDFIRMRFAARDMEMSCQALILEALDCYLDANDVAPVTDEMCEAEVERLSKKGARKRPAVKAGVLAE